MPVIKCCPLTEQAHRYTDKIECVLNSTKIQFWEDFTPLNFSNVRSGHFLDVSNGTSLELSQNGTLQSLDHEGKLIADHGLKYCVDHDLEGEYFAIVKEDKIYDFLSGNFDKMELGFLIVGLAIILAVIAFFFWRSHRKRSFFSLLIGSHILSFLLAMIFSCFWESAVLRFVSNACYLFAWLLVMLINLHMCNKKKGFSEKSIARRFCGTFATFIASLVIALCFKCTTCLGHNEWRYYGFFIIISLVTNNMCIILYLCAVRNERGSLGRIFRVRRTDEKSQNVELSDLSRNDPQKILNEDPAPFLPPIANYQVERKQNLTYLDRYIRSHDRLMCSVFLTISCAICLVVQYNFEFSFMYCLVQLILYLMMAVTLEWKQLRNCAKCCH